MSKSRHFVGIIFMILICCHYLHAAEEEPKTGAVDDTTPVLKCSDHVIVQKAMIAALQSKLETQAMRITALSNLLGASQRESVDTAAQARIAAAERKILSNMGLAADCKIQRDGSIKCPPAPASPGTDTRTNPDPPETGDDLNQPEATSP